MMERKYTLEEHGMAGFTLFNVELERIMQFFEPNWLDEDEEDETAIESFKKEHEAWERAMEECTLEATQEYIDTYVNEVDGIHYHDYVVEEL